MLSRNCVYKITHKDERRRDNSDNPPRLAFLPHNRLSHLLQPSVRLEQLGLRSALLANLLNHHNPRDLAHSVSHKIRHRLSGRTLGLQVHLVVLVNKTNNNRSNKPARLVRSVNRTSSNHSNHSKARVCLEVELGRLVKVNLSGHSVSSQLYDLWGGGNVLIDLGGSQGSTGTSAFSTFGQTNQQQQPATGTTNLFGQPNQQQPQTGTSTFGTGTNTFGTGNSLFKPATTPAFGTQPATNAFSAFGQNQQNQPQPQPTQGTNLFGQPVASTNMFGQNTQQQQQQAPQQSTGCEYRYWYIM